MGSRSSLVALCKSVAGRSSFVDWSSALAAGMGSRLSLCAALAPDLAVAPPASDLCSLAPLLQAGKPLQVGASPIDHDVICAMRGVAVHVRSALPFLQPGSTSSSAGSKGHGYPVLGVGVAIAAIAVGVDTLDDVLLYCKDQSNNCSCVGRATGKCNQCSPGGCGGNKEDEERYRSIIKLLQELCLDDLVDSDEARSNFQKLKFLMQREWRRLHEWREEIKAARHGVEAAKSKNFAVEVELDRRLTKLEEDLAQLAIKEEEFELKVREQKEDTAKLEEDKMEFSQERAELYKKLDEMFSQAAVKQKEAEDLYFRATLDSKTVSDLFKEWNSAQNAGSNSSTDGLDETGSSSKGKGDDETGSSSKGKGDGDEKTGFWSKVWSVLDFPASAAANVIWVGEWLKITSTAVLAVYVTGTEAVPSMNEETWEDVKTSLKKKLEISKDNTRKTLIDFGLMKKKESPEDK